METGLVKIQAAISDAASVAVELRRQRIDGLYLDLDVAEDPDAVFQAVASLPEPRPLILLGSMNSNPETLLRAMRLGITNFFVGHKLAELESIIRAVLPQRTRSERAAPIIAVMGTKGGVGATTVACELAVALQEAGVRSVVCDLDMRLGDVPLYFDLKPTYSIADIAKQEGALDAAFIDAVVVEHSSEVSVLAAPVRFEDLGGLSYAQVERILEFLRKEFDCIVVDIPWAFDELSLRMLDAASQILMVTTPGVASLTHTRTLRTILERTGTPDDLVHVVVNRASKADAFGEQQIAEFLECEIDVVIPDCPAAARKCMDEGLLLRATEGGEEMKRQIHVLRDRVSEWCRFETPAGTVETNHRSLASRLRKLVTRR
jgi:pilus assembly protein CpaE